MKYGIKTHTCEELVPNPDTCEKLVQNYYSYEERVLNRHRYQWQSSKELDSNVICSRFFFGGGGEGGVGSYFINVSNMHVCYIKFDFVRIIHKMWDIGTKYVVYWNQIFTCCEELVPFVPIVRNWYQFFTVWNLQRVLFAVQHSCLAV